MGTGRSIVDGRPTICLSMIVRNEAGVVRDTLDAVAPYIDHWVIVDTGSTDATVHTIGAHMAAKGVAGEITERPWRGFGFNRTEALELCRGRSDYIWVIDADDLVIGNLDLSGLSADSYLLRYGRECRYWRKQIFRDGLRWRYDGIVHEYPVCLDPATEARLGGDYYVESRRLGAHGRAEDTYARDCALLHEALEHDPTDVRATFYLAQSYYDTGDYARALAWYTRRAAMGGWDEEVFYSLLRRGACLTLLGERTLARVAYLKAWHARPTRAEPLYELARQCRLGQEFELGYLFAKRAAGIPYPEDDSLFIAADVYTWRALDELAICAYYNGQHQESFELLNVLLEESSVPEADRARIEANRDVSMPTVAEDRRRYPAERVALEVREYDPALALPPVALCGNDVDADIQHDCAPDASAHAGFEVSSLQPIPNQFHFVYGLGPGRQPFHLVHYLCLRSCLEVNRPEAIYLHYHKEPRGRYWELIKPAIVAAQLEPAPFVSSYRYRNRVMARYRYAHQADFLRLEVLSRHGGVYADIDTIFVNPLPASLFEQSFVIGRESDVVDERTGRHVPSLCNAFLMSEPQAPFTRLWLDQIEGSFDGSWNAHSTLLPERLRQQHPDLLHVEPSRSFYKHLWTREGIQMLLEGRDTDFEAVYSLHLWAHLWWSRQRNDLSHFNASKLTEAYVRSGKTTYALAAGRFLPRPSNS